MIAAHRICVHKINAAIIDVNGDIHNGCKSATDSNRCTSFDSKLTNLPGAVFVIARCDKQSVCTN